MNVADIRAAVTQVDPDDYKIGNWCIFVPLGNGWGVKFYNTEERRDWAWIAQGYAAEVGAGPKVGPCLTVRVTPSMEESCPDEVIELGEHVYGYLTECVQTIGITVEDYTVLEKRLAKIGLDMWDTTLQSNVGYLKNGQPVQFDFDSEYALARVLGKW